MRKLYGGKGGYDVDKTDANVTKVHDMWSTYRCGKAMLYVMWSRLMLRVHCDGYVRWSGLMLYTVNADVLWSRRDTKVKGPRGTVSQVKKGQKGYYRVKWI